MAALDLKNRRLERELKIKFEFYTFSMLANQ